MTEQQYRVVADRDKGDRPWEYPRTPGDRVTYQIASDMGAEMVRIERPVSTFDDRLVYVKHPVPTAAEQATGLTDEEDMERRLVMHEKEHPSVPTREQIAEAVLNSGGMGIESDSDDVRQIADAVLALIQKGTDRG